MEYSLPYLGKKDVKVIIDRPLGSKHPRHSYIYQVNYGFVPDTQAPDGAELDVYVLGVADPLAEFCGDCIAIIHRLDDDDDKLIIVPTGVDFSDKQIRELTNFQEQWFNSEIIRFSKQP